jgi:hypothetical protein
MPTRFALLQLLRLLETEAKKFTTEERRTGGISATPALGASHTAKTNTGNRRVEALPPPTASRTTTTRNELYQLVDDPRERRADAAARRADAW